MTEITDAQIQAEMRRKRHNMIRVLALPAFLALAAPALITANSVQIKSGSRGGPSELAFSAASQFLRRKIALSPEQEREEARLTALLRSLPVSLLRLLPAAPVPEPTRRLSRGARPLRGLRARGCPRMRLSGRA